MRLPALLLGAAAIAIPACAGSLEREFEQGRTTSYARQVLASAETAPAAEAAATPADAETEAVRKRLEALASVWRSRARERPADPAALGFALASPPDDEALKKGLAPGIVLAAAYARSPAIRAAREDLKATVEQFSQVAYLDALLRQYVSFTKDLDLRIGAPRQKETIEGLFPFPGSMALKSRIVEEDAKAAEERLAGTVRAVLVAMGQAYDEYAYVGEAIRIVEENVDLLGGIVEIARARYGVGKAQQGAVLRTQVEIASLRNRLVTLRERLATVRARMNSILDLPPDFPLGEPATPAAAAPPSSPEALYVLAKDHRQEILALRARIRRTEALIELAETQAFPDLSLGFSRFEEGGGSRVGGARMMEPFPETPRPKPRLWFGETASFIEEMRSRLEGMKQSLADLEARVAFQVKNAWFEWDAAWREVRLHEDSILPRSEQAYRVLESGFQEGITSYLDALDAQRTWLGFRLSDREAVMRSDRSRLALLDALGTAIPEEGR